MSELKRCPFCGGEAEIVDEKRYCGNEGYSVKFVKCRECDVCTKERISDGYFNEYCTDEEIAELWNTRKPMERIVERLEQQRKQYKRRAEEQEGVNLTVKISEKFFGKACSYEHAIKIVKEESGINE